MSPSSIPTTEEEYAAQLRDLEKASADMKKCEAIYKEVQRFAAHMEAGVEAFRALGAMQQWCLKENNVHGMRQLFLIHAQLLTHMMPTITSLESLQSMWEEFVRLDPELSSLKLTEAAVAEA
ncbi:hypothetical protein E4U52_001450 [Claviceps spartinae]|nr:hypothetical protein E4U52_001450 [Claviceps spartinae]